MTAAPAAREHMPVELYLPDAWWSVDLRSARTRERSILALVDQQVGRADDRAVLRAELRAALGRRAREAARAGAFLIAFSLMRHDDLPLPAALVAHRVPRAGGGELRALEAALSAQRPGLSKSPDAPEAPTPHESLELVDADRGTLLRRTRVERARLDPASAEVPMLRADYWLDLPDAPSLVLLAFSTCLLDAAEAFLDLFDTIASTVAVAPSINTPDPTTPDPTTPDPLTKDPT